MGMHQAVILVRPIGRSRDDELTLQRRVYRREPSFPLAGGLWLAVGKQQILPAERASSVLRLDAEHRGRYQRWRLPLASPIGPILGQSRVIRVCPPDDQRVADDLRPGKLVEVDAADAVVENPLVLPGFVESAEIPG